ncbi:MAG: hypothetical protein WDA12_01105 [Bacilli bacterium]
MKITNKLKNIIIISTIGLTSVTTLSFLSAFLSSFVAFILIYKFKLLERFIDDNNYLIENIEYIISFILTTYSIYYFLTFWRSLSSNIYIIPFAVLAIPSLFVIYLILIRNVLPIILNFFQNLSKAEKIFFIVSTVCMTIIIFNIYSNTNAFYYPINKNTGKPKLYNVIYSSDNGGLIRQDSFKNFKGSENDLRQPLFGVFSFPFGLVSEGVARANIFSGYIISYSFMISFFQVLLLSVMAILISRMVTKKDSLLVMILFGISFPTILFAINIEQFTIATFFLILLIYNWVQKDKPNPLLFCMASGTLITSGVLLPFILKKDKIKKYILEGIKYCLIFIIIIIVVGLFCTFVDNILNYSKFMKYMGKEINFGDKMLQYINFVSSCLITPSAMIERLSADNVSYQLAPVTSVNILGIIILMIAIISFILNRSEKIVQVSFGWIIYSFIILCIMGWGTSENGLILYALYFSWAFIILIYKFIQKLFDNDLMRKIVLSTIIIGILFINTNGIIDIVKFGIEYYPTRNAK